MGRPLFSKPTSAPVVRVEPEPTAPQHPTYEKWTYLNAFDPDSDEFFENDDAVYEAFLEHDHLPPLTEVREGERDEGIHPSNTFAGDDELSSVSSGSSESDDEVPSTAATEQVPPSFSGIMSDQLAQSVARISARRVQILNSRRTVEPVVVSAPLARSPTPVPNDDADDDDHIDTPATPPPVERPSTPPNQSTSRDHQFNATPSPPPTVTPRLYSWPTRNLPIMPLSPTGPLPNRNARMSVAHIRPASLIPVNRVLG